MRSSRASGLERASSFPLLSSGNGLNVDSPFSNSENEHAQRRNITQVICISKEPLTDLEREGFKKAPDLDKTVFTLESDTEGDLLPIFGEVCSIIDRTFGNGECVLVWDVGGGVAALAAYRKYNTAYALTSFARASH